MSRNYTMRKTCPACRCSFVIGGSAAVYCPDLDCKNRRRRADYKAKKNRTGAYAVAVPEGSAGHLERALKSGK